MDPSFLTQSNLTFSSLQLPKGPLASDDVETMILLWKIGNLCSGYRMLNMLAMLTK